jgi:hypothetical protein
MKNKEVEDFTHQHRTNNKEYICCAALHFHDGKEYVFMPKNIKSGFVITGYRHHNCYAIYTAIIKLNGTTDFDIDNTKYPKDGTDGFLTSYDRFVDRKEAAQIAFEANQTKINTELLFSEDIY